MARQVGSAYVDVTARTKNLNTGMEEARRATRKAMAEMRTEVREASHTIEILGEQVGVHLPRALRKFVAELPGVGKAMAAAFEGAAIIGLGAIAIETGRKIYESFEKMQELPEKIEGDWKKINDQLALSNVQMELSNDKLANEIAKFKGAPENKLKVQLDEAAASAMKLAAELSKANAEALKTLQTDQVTWWQNLFGVAGTSDLTTQTSAFKKKVDEFTDEATARILQKRKESNKEGVDDQVDEEKKGLAKIFADRIAALEKERDAAQKVRSRPDVVIPFMGPVPISKDEQARLNAINGQIRNLQLLAASTADTFESLRLSQEHSGQTGLSAAERLKQAQKELFEDLQHQEKVQADATAFQERLTESLTQTWIAAQHADEEAAKVAEEGQRRAAEAAKKAKEERLQAAAEEQGAVRQGLSETFAEFAQYEQMRVDFGEETNQERLANLQEDLAQTHDLIQASFDDQLANYDGDEKGYKKLLAEKEKDTFQFAMETAALQKQALESGIGGAFLEIERKAKDAAGTMRDTFTQAINSMNDALTNLMTGKKANFASLFEGVAQNLGKAALTKLEGTVFSQFGLGGKKPTGAAGDPIHVTSDDDPIKQGIDIGGKLGGSPDVATAIGNTGGLFGQVLGSAMSFLPFLQSGGPTIPGRSYIVGERGMELFTPNSAGTVHSNAALRSLGGSSTTIHIPIDARGSSDPAAVHAAVHRAMREYVPAIIGASHAFDADQKRRVPITSKAAH